LAFKIFLIIFLVNKGKKMRLVLTDKMLLLALQHQNRDLYFEKFEELVRETYPEWSNASRNEIFKKFQAVYNREDKIEDLNREREICLKLMKEQYHVNSIDKDLSKRQSKRNYNYWASRIKNINEELIELGYKPESYPSYNSLKLSENIKTNTNIFGWLIALGLFIYTLYIIFK